MGSTLLNRVQGTSYVFVMNAAQSALASQGVQPGDVVLEVERDGPGQIQIALGDGVHLAADHVDRIAA